MNFTCSHDESSFETVLGIFLDFQAHKVYGFIVGDDSCCKKIQVQYG